MSLAIKDASGSVKNLETQTSDSGNLVPVHAISGSISASFSEADIGKITGSIKDTTTEVAKLTALSGSGGFKITGSISLQEYTQLSGTISSSAAATTAEVAKLTALSSSAGLKVTGSVTASLSQSDLSSLTGSMLAVSSSVAAYNQQLYQALVSGSSIAMNVDIVAGDVNAITGSVDKVTAEVAKLTALSSSLGVRTYTKQAASTTLNNQTLAALKTGINIVANPNRLSYFISNRSDATVYVGLDTTATNLPTDATFSLFPGETYESTVYNAAMKFAVKLDASATTGNVVITETQ